MKYILRPAEIEAIQWTGKNPAEVIAFLDNFHKYAVFTNTTIKIIVNGLQATAEIGDYIIKSKGINVMKENLFERVYAAAK